MKFLTCRFRGAPLVTPAVHPAAVGYGGKTPRARKSTPPACPAGEPCQVIQSGYVYALLFKRTADVVVFKQFRNVI